MLVYRPSAGNDITQVGLSKDGTWFGESLGGSVVPRLNLPISPKNPVESNLSSASSWFYKDVTDYDFINGTAIYRALYIGANDKFNESEIIGTIAASVTNNSGNSALDDSVEISVWQEGGQFDLPSSKYYGAGIVLDNEMDTTGKLSNAVWTPSIDYSDELVSGKYIKVWIKIKYKEDISLLDLDGFSYTFTVKDLVITVNRDTGRLNISKIYTVQLKETADNNFILRETLPYQFESSNILKVIDHLGSMNVFYLDEAGKFKIISVQNDVEIEKNKYVEIDISPIAGNISGSITDQLFTEVSECVTNSTTGSTTGSPTTGSSTTGSQEGISYLDKRFIIDIHASSKDRNIFYVFYNEFVSDSDSEYQINYGHKHYSWKHGVIKIDLENINDYNFSDVGYGLENKKSIQITDVNLVYELDTSHYVTAVVMLDDLFALSGFDVEDCRLTNCKAKLTYIWERDIIKSDIKIQKTIIPKAENNELTTIKNKSNKESYLVFDKKDLIDYIDLDYNRSTITLDNGAEYVNMASQTRRRVKHEYSAVSYDVPLEIDDFSCTWSFSVDAESVTTQTTGTTSTPTTSSPSTSSPTTSSPSTGVGASNKLILDNPYVVHLRDQLDYNEAILNSENQNLFVKTRTWRQGLVSIFNLHCNGDVSNYALSASYDFSDKTWKFLTKDKDDNVISTDVLGDILGQELSVDYDNVITVNITRVQVHGCAKKYHVHFDVYVFGKLLLAGETYTTETTDTYVISHNYNNEFSGSVCYFEVREHLDSTGDEYAYAMFQIHTNLSWCQLENEVNNINSNPGFEFYGFKRSLLVNNLSWSNEENTVIFPIVLQGNAYNIGEEFNAEVRRSVFDFNKIDVNRPSFEFTFEGVSNKLEWYCENYDFDKDMMVVWVRLDNWKGQRIIMYYGDVRLIQDARNDTRIFRDFYGVWLMDRFVKERYLRYTFSKIFDVGEGMLVQTNENGTFMLQLDKQYMFGLANLYKSNSFDIKYDDHNVSRQRQEYVTNFVTDQIKEFKPAFMEIRKVDSINQYKIESNNSEASDV